MIKLDLRNLTPELVAKTRPNMGGCRYSAPCIIGALMEPADRERFDMPTWIYSDGVDSVSRLIDGGEIEFPTAEEGHLANLLQEAFDCRYVDRFDRLMEDVYKLKVPA